MNKLKQFFSWYSARNSLLSQNTLILWTKRLTMLISLLVLSIVSLIFTQLPPLIPLWYSLPWGEGRLATPLWLFILPLSSFLIQIGNSLLSARLPDDYLIFAQLLILTSAIVSLMNFVTLINIITLVR